MLYSAGHWYPAFPSSWGLNVQRVSASRDRYFPYSRKNAAWVGIGQMAIAIAVAAIIPLSTYFSKSICMGTSSSFKEKKVVSTNASARWPPDRLVKWRHVSWCFTSLVDSGTTAIFLYPSCQVRGTSEERSLLAALQAVLLTVCTD